MLENIIRFNYGAVSKDLFNLVVIARRVSKAWVCSFVRAFFTLKFVGAFDLIVFQNVPLYLPRLVVCVNMVVCAHL